MVNDCVICIYMKMWRIFTNLHWKPEFDGPAGTVISLRNRIFTRISCIITNLLWILRYILDFEERPGTLTFQRLISFLFSISNYETENCFQYPMGFELTYYLFYLFISNFNQVCPVNISYSHHDNWDLPSSTIALYWLRTLAILLESFSTQSRLCHLC